MATENWHFDADGRNVERHGSINDVAIDESQRLFHWDMDGPRPHDHPGLTEPWPLGSCADRHCEHGCTGAE